MEFFFISLLNGLSYGLLLFMLTAGLTLVFSLMGVLNFAHASFYMLGAYFGYQVSQWTGFWAGLIVAPLLVGLVGMAVERWGLRPIHKHGHVAELLFTFGLAYLIEEAVHLIWGRSALDYKFPPELAGTLFNVFGTGFPAYRGFMMLVALAMLAGIYLALTRTRIGLIIQAALTHPGTVEALGHNVPRVFMIVFGMGAALAGLAGVIGGAAFVTEPAMAARFGPLVFVIVVVGGMGSLGGAFVASLLLGVIDSFAVASDFSVAHLLNAMGLGVTKDTPGYSVLSVTLSQASKVIPFLLMVLILIFRPKGLFGTREG
jgi:branched-chain amino acid transport system permease protein